MTGVVVESDVTRGTSPVVRWLVAIGGFFALFFATAWLSQRWILHKWDLAESVDLPAPSVVPHAATMTVVAVLALASAVPLLVAGAARPAEGPGVRRRGDRAPSSRGGPSVRPHR